jgi:DNA replication protein DnaC
MVQVNLSDNLNSLLKTLRLPSFSLHHEQIAREAANEGWSFGQYLLSLCETEAQERYERKVERFIRQSSIPLEKTMETLDTKRLGKKIQQQMIPLCDGNFLSRNENILVFGLPGRGKTHLVCAIGHELIRKGYRILFRPAYKLVQRLLIAKRDLVLEKELKRLDKYDAVIIDDIGYVQQSQEEMEVLFTFLSERYERKSIIITSNLVFSQWDKIFKDKMVTACAIDRLVHHSIILELSGESYRTEKAKNNNQNPTTIKKTSGKMLPNESG